MKDTLIQQVLEILEQFPDTRNSDIELTIQLWKRFYPEDVFTTKHGTDVIAVRKLFELPREDNIKRVRAKIQNEERKFLPTDINVFIKRAKLSKEWQLYLGYNNQKTDEDFNKLAAEYYKLQFEPKQKELF